VFSSDFYLLEAGEYTIRVQASWMLPQPETRLFSLTLYAH
jgi:hypothetical protein